MRIQGYAALYGAPDLEGDVVRRGAFASRPARLPMLLRHDAKLAVGEWDALVDDARGLFVAGDIADDLPAAALAERLVRSGVDGLSIGFVTRAARPIPGGRELLAVQLLEISIVEAPMQPRARLSIAYPLKETA